MPELLRSFDETQSSGFEALLFSSGLVFQAPLFFKRSWKRLRKMKMPGARPGISFLPIRAAVAR
jgi:hypothetical protein